MPTPAGTGFCFFLNRCPALRPGANATIAMKPRSNLILAAALAATLVSARASVFIDTFDTYAVGPLPGTYTTETGWEVVNDPSFGAGSQVARGSGSQNNLMTSFAVTSLAIGEGIAVQFDYRYLGAPTAVPQANFVRFGLYTSAGTAAYDDDRGFHAGITHYDNATPGTGGFYDLRYEGNSVDLFAGMLLDNQPGVLTAPPPDSDGLTLGFDPSKTANDGTTVHTARLEIRNLGIGTGLRVYLDDFSTAKLSTFTATNVLTFDRFLLETPFGTGVGTEFHVDNVSVETLSAVPEPGEYAVMFGAGMIGFAVWRRRLQSR